MKKTKAKVSKTISENISFKEATFSNTAKRLKIKNQPSETHIKNMKTIAEKCFQPLREWCGHPIRINSMYRNPDLCEAIKSSKNSQHTKGQAIDMSSLGEKTNGELFEWIKENLDFDQLIWEFGNDESPKWIHISYVNKKSNRNRILRAKYKGSSVTYHII
jgi:zinc D-Ala-D-Ala carboxypeptidase